ncbi:MAG: sigma-70 family RNA polymerase sigma factor [Bacteroidales bacterium]
MSEKEFENIVLQSARRLYSVAFRILRRKEDAEDAVQETFLKLWRMKIRLGEYDCVEALAVTVVRNHCLDVVRKRRLEIPVGNDSAHSATDDLPTPFEVLRATETGEIIVAILERMPPNYAEVIRWRDIEGHSYNEIAVALNQNINNVRVTVSRARKMIRDEYRRVEYEGCEFRKTAREVL